MNTTERNLKATGKDTKAKNYITKEEVQKRIDIETRLIYVYSTVMILDIIDGYIQELECATKKANLFRHEYKQHLNALKNSFRKHSDLLLNARYMKESAYEELTNALDKLDDEFSNDIKLFYLSLRQYLLNHIPDSIIVTCIARASVIEVLSSYSLMNDKGMLELIRKTSGRPIGIHNDDMQKINFHAKEYIRLFSNRYKDIDVNLNDCEAAANAFDVINRKVLRIPEFIYEDRTN